MKRSWAVLALCAALPHAAAAGAEKPLGVGCRNEEAFLMATVVAEVKHRKFDSHYALGSTFESRRESAVRHENNRNVFRAKVSGLHNWIDRRQLHETEEPPTDKERVALYTRHFEAWACTAPVGPEHFATDPEAVEGHAPLDLYHWTIAYRGDPTMAARDQSLFFGGRSKAPEAKLTCEELFGTDVRLGIGEP